ncbi:MAG: dihydrodipicolinate reductase [Planctomycetes bacterium]|nr:dihydrodipicolinate reductase [Planctomycetota bacterium]
MTAPLRVLSFGLGPIGLSAARLVLRKQSLELVGAVDKDPEKAGKDLAELLELGDATGVVVEPDVEAALDRLRPDVVVHCTSSFLPDVKEQLLACVARGASVVSSTEELLLAEHQHPELAKELDAAAIEGGATILGTGVNPGFAMDYLAVIASAVCSDVTTARCVRVVDAATRREPLQRKVGAGLTKGEFHKLLDAGKFGHIGMRESVALVGRGLGFELDRIEQTVEPVLAPEDHKTPFLVVKEGEVAGIRNLGYGYVGKRLAVKLDLSMYVGAPDPHDLIELESSPPVSLRFPDGIAGDEATAAILVNHLIGAEAAPHGLRNVLEVPVPRVAR